jgi:glycosyltransferase involved in cell wall biosynthesis
VLVKEMKSLDINGQVVPLGALPKGTGTIRNSTESAALVCSCDLSVVIPVFNEVENLPILQQQLAGALDKLKLSYEIIYVDDGSTDGSLVALQKIAQSGSNVRIIELRRNFGQTAAISAGMDHSQGKIIVCLDADLQNDPKDIPILLAKIAEGYDLVSGWRKKRQDHWLSRTLVSSVANRLISLITDVKLHDYGCTLKAYRRDLLHHIRLYGQMHRFIPALAVLVGAKIAEIPVNHRPRRFGKSKYGLNRMFTVLLDLLTVKFLGSFSSHPINLFGGSGLFLIGASIVTGFIMVFQKFFYHQSFIQTPLLLFSALLFILGFQSILMGLSAELLIRTYHESQGKPTYIIRRIITSDCPDAEPEDGYSAHRE